jgi:hypothetical protein
MNPKFFSSMSNQVYSPLWNKYRPAILQLMVACEEGPKQYKLFSHEFKALNAKEKGYSFSLTAFQGKALNDIKNSTTAKDLLYMLAVSRKAMELMDGDTYEFKLDKNFTLHVSKQAAKV